MNFTDTQVLTLVRANPCLNLYQLRQKAEEEMGRWAWTIGKIQAAVRRLEDEGKIKTETVVHGGRSCVLVSLK
jgi:DNA-binding PadR family transcriptional regulator